MLQNRRGSRSTFLLALVLFGVGALPIAGQAAPGATPTASAPNPAASDALRVAFQLNGNNVEANLFALLNAQAFVERARDDKRSIDLRIIVFGKAVSNFRKPIGPELAKAYKVLSESEGVHFYASQTSLTYFKLKRSELLKGFDVVPSGAYEIVNLQKQGFAYFSP